MVVFSLSMSQHTFNVVKHVWDKLDPVIMYFIEAMNGGFCFFDSLDVIRNKMLLDMLPGNQKVLGPLY